MTRAGSLEWLPVSQRQPRFGLWAALGCFYLGQAVLYLPTLLPTVIGTVLITAGLALALVAAPIEYAIGALGFSFLAAACRGTSVLFYDARWAVLAAAAPLVTIRFVLRRRPTYAAKANLFDYLMLFFLAIAAATLLSTFSVAMTALKLGALGSMLYAASQGLYRMCDLYGPAAPRRLTQGFLAYAACPIVVSVVHYALGFGPASIRNGWFVGLPGSANAWAVLVAIVLPWCTAPLFRRARRPAGWPLALLTGVMLLAYLLLLSGSRAGLLGSLAALSLLAVVHLDRRVAGVVLLATFLVTVHAVANPDFIPSQVQKYLYKHPVGQEDIFQSRLEPWKRAEENFREHPWLGYGFGITSEAQTNWTPDTQSGSGAVETGSSVWGSLGQVGILGCAFLFGAILLLAYRAVIFCWRVRDPWLTGVCGSMLALLVNALFEGWLLAPGNFTTFYFWAQCFLLNGMMCRFRPAPERRWSAAVAGPSFRKAPAPGSVGSL